MAHVPLTVLYEWRDSGTDEYERENHFGVIGFEPGVKKPAYNMFRATWSRLLNRPFLAAKRPAGCTVREHWVRFGSRSNDVMSWSVVWTDDTMPHTLQLNSPITEVVNIFGKPVVPISSNTGKTLVLTGSPLLIHHSTSTVPNFACSN